MEQKVISSNAIKFGTVLGLLFAIIHIASWASGSTATFVSVIGIELLVPYAFALIFWGAFYLRKQQGGFIAFKDVLKFAFLSYVIITGFEALVNYLLYNVLDKQLTAKVLEITKEKTIAFMKKVGATEEQLNDSIKKIDGEKKETSLKNIFLGTGMGLVINFVKAMIIAAIVKKEKKFEDIAV